MADEDSSQEKTEEATPRRLEKAREEGQIPRSRDLTTSAVLILGSVGLWIFGGRIAETLMNVLRFNFTHPTFFYLGAGGDYRTDFSGRISLFRQIHRTKTQPHGSVGGFEADVFREILSGISQIYRQGRGRRGGGLFYLAHV
jgi:hypothetical protein